MALNAYLFLEIDGNGVEGENAPATLEREGSIVCHAFTMGGYVSSERLTSRQSSRLQYQPVEFTKLIDMSTPSILQALAENKSVDAEFRFYRHRQGDGGEEHYYTVTLRDARISSVQQIMEKVFDKETTSWPVYETVQISFGSIQVTYHTTGMEFEDRPNHDA